MRHSKRSLEGEIFIDHRASPGLTREQLPLDAPAVGKGQLYESAIALCEHCHFAIVLEPNRTRERGWCAKCDRYLCDDCTEAYGRTFECRSMARRLDEYQNAIERQGPSAALLHSLVTTKGR